METNLDGVFLCSQAATPALKDTRGAIVNIASISGLRASTLRVAYGTSKAAVMHLTRQQAAELGEHGIRVNCVCPGPVRTKLAMAVHSQAIIDAYHDAIPLNRYGSEDEIAAVIAFLCSPEASYVTGQIIAADGGFEATAIGLPALRGLAENAEGPCREYGRVMRMERIGVLGLGRMGSAMARKLAASGATVTGWTRSARTVDGVAAAPDLAALVQASDTLILSLYDDAAVTEMLDALLQHDLAGRLILETSTVVPQILIDRAGAFAAKGAQVADAPVSGGPEMVAAGTCGFFVGADPEVAERAMPVLTAISPRVLHMGSLGVGMAMKTINNAMLQIYIAGLCEMLPIAKRAGISMEDALGVADQRARGNTLLARQDAQDHGGRSDRRVHLERHPGGQRGLFAGSPRAMASPPRHWRSQGRAMRARSSGAWAHRTLRSPSPPLIATLEALAAHQRPTPGITALSRPDVLSERETPSCQDCCLHWPRRYSPLPPCPAQPARRPPSSISPPTGTWPAAISRSTRPPRATFSPRARTWRSRNP